MTRTLWVGGSSGLARTFVNKYGLFEGLILAGLEPEAPAWAAKEHWIQCDLTLPCSSVDCENIETLIISVRAPLVFGDSQRHQDMLLGLRKLVETAASSGTLRRVLHISSVAAVNHLQTQVEITEETPLPPLDSYAAGYDIFKRGAEDDISEICESHGILYTHLRISAIFSDDESCIQCGALQIQSRVGSYLPTRIDCNSSANVAAAINLLLAKFGRADADKHVEKLYYYTRPTRTPVAYGEHLVAYRKAYNITVAVWLPFWLVRGFVSATHALVHGTWLRYWPPAISLDYLLQVSAREHTFCNDKFRSHFPEIGSQEETIFEAFVRRKKTLEQQQ